MEGSGEGAGAGGGGELPASIPHQTLPALFLRFLRFGALAWGGPVAQIGMLQKELVEEERWIPMERFHRALAVYQVLPGPEAHELCVYFGMLARGRPGAVVAGLGFMLPGFLLMFALSFAYVTFGLREPLLASLFLGLQAAVVALIVRAVHRIGGHALRGAWLLGVGTAACAADLAGAPFAATLAAAGGVVALAHDGRRSLRIGVGALLLAGLLAWAGNGGPPPEAAAAAPAEPPSAAGLFGYGLRSGLLTFGGAYTAIPFLRHDAVVVGGWMTDAQFLDGIALGGVLPAPLIIFATFVGFMGGGAAGALAMTAGIFLPAFLFTLLGHRLLEGVTGDPRVRSLLDGVTAGVVGLIAATTVRIFREGVRDAPTLALFGGALLVLYLWKSRAAVPAVVLGAGLLGMALLG